MFVWQHVDIAGQIWHAPTGELGGVVHHPVAGTCARSSFDLLAQRISCSRLLRLCVSVIDTELSRPRVRADGLMLMGSAIHEEGVQVCKSQRVFAHAPSDSKDQLK